jgi:hypothetical protein
MQNFSACGGPQIRCQPLVYLYKNTGTDVKKKVACTDFPSLTRQTVLTIVLKLIYNHPRFNSDIKPPLPVVKPKNSTAPGENNEGHGNYEILFLFSCDFVVFVANNTP